MKTRMGWIVIVLVAAACAKSSGAAFKVTAHENGYSPAAITIAKGQPASIEFVRTTDKTCAREVVFPELGIKKDLPLDTPVVVTLPAGEAKTYTFQCGMAMFKGSVVVQ